MDRIRVTRHFEDLVVGWSNNYGSQTVTEAEIIEFAKKFDPQPFHIDKQAAEDSIFGGIVASGLHTLCLSVRMYTDGFLHDIDLVAGRGLDDVRFENPVYPGDQLSIQVNIVDKETAGTKPSWGNVKIGLETENQSGDIVLSFIDRSIIRRRDG